MSRKREKQNSIGGQFAPRLIEMLESPAYRALSLSGRRVLERIEIELAQHGGSGKKLAGCPSPTTISSATAFAEIALLQPSGSWSRSSS